MMTKLAHIRENRKNNKGFSLVELIIVIAIMVALIAVMGPQYVKYVQSSRDAVVSDAAESVLSVVKSEFALNNLALKTGSDSGEIKIGADSGNGTVDIACGSDIVAGANATSGYNFINICGVDTAKSVKSSKVYTIKVTYSSINGGYDFTMSGVDAADADLVKATANVTK